MNVYIKKMLPVVIVCAFSPVFGMEQKKEVKRELMPADHPAYNPLSGNQCYLNDNTLDVRNDLERVLPAELSVKINQMSGILTDEAKKWLAGVLSEFNVLDLEFSPDSKRVGTEFKDGTCKVIDLETKQVLLSESNVWGCDFSPHSKLIGIKFDDCTCKVIDLETKQVLLSESKVQYCDFSADNNRVGILFRDDTYQVIDLETKQVLLSESNVWGCDFSADNNRVGILFRDDTYKVIDLELLSSLKHLTVCQALYLQEFYEYMMGKKKISEKEGAKIYNTEHGLAVFRTLPKNIRKQLIRLRKEHIQSAQKRLEQEQKELKKEKSEQENSWCLIQ